MTGLFADLLARRVKSDGARPLLTCYPGAAAPGQPSERTELSAISYANWVAKTANLLEELGADAGTMVALPVLRDHPASWMALAWAGACWSAGCIATPSEQPDGTPLVVVTGPEPTAPPPGQIRIACSLHPMGLGLRDPLPAGVIDWASEARAQPDDFYPAVPPGPGDLAWLDDAGPQTQADLTSGAGTPARALVIADDPWSTVRDALLAPLLGGGSAVVVGTGVEAAERARIAASERIS